MAEKEKKQNRIFKFFKDLKSELSKITWPSWKETKKKSAVVIIELVIVGTFVGLLDFGLLKLIEALSNAFS